MKVIKIKKIKKKKDVVHRGLGAGRTYKLKTS
jgi:hypothetical protein